MAAVLVDVAEEIKEELNTASAAGDFSLPFEAVRSWADWDEKLKDLDKLHVDVVSGGAKIKLADRVTLDYLVSVDIGIRKRFKDTDRNQDTGQFENASIDALVLLQQEIFEFFAPMSADAGRALAALPEAVWKEFEPRVWVDRSLLRENDQFMGIARIIHEVSRQP